MADLGQTIAWLGQAIRQSPPQAPEAQVTEPTP